MRKILVKKKNWFLWKFWNNLMIYHSYIICNRFIKPLIYTYFWSILHSVSILLWIFWQDLRENLSAALCHFCIFLYTNSQGFLESGNIIYWFLFKRSNQCDMYEVAWKSCTKCIQMSPCSDVPSLDTFYFLDFVLNKCKEECCQSIISF